MTQVAKLNLAEVRDRLGKAEIAAEQARHGVNAYRVVYRTIDVDGKQVTASALVALPRSAKHRLEVVSWMHGTTVYRDNVASVNENSVSRAAAVLFASTGRAISAPDYLGLGKSPGLHPYGDPQATVSASLDALRATRVLAQRKQRTLAQSVSISGFSQGGPAAMLLGRALQRGVDQSFQLAALAPISSPFHLSAFEAAAASDEVAKSPLYLAYWATAWDRMYGLYEPATEAFQMPYAAKITDLFDGQHTPKEIAAQLPKTSAELFTTEFLRRVQDPRRQLNRKFQPMDTTCAWRPQVPVHLYAASGDEDVSIAHSRHCQRQLTAHGAQHRLIDLGEVGHTASARKALPRVARQFDTG